MNKKGFTLIELLMVITLIGILSLILVPNVMSLNNKNKVESCKKLNDNIISAAKVYVTNYRDELGFTCDETKEISIDSLKKSGSLNDSVVNPIDKSNVTGKVRVTYNCSSKSFSYLFNLNCN